MLDCKNITSLYVHIPFCKHICSYCDFTKLFYIEEYATKYIEQLFKEIDSYNLSQLKTIYVGGGTPTALNDHLFESLIKRFTKWVLSLFSKSPQLKFGEKLTLESLAALINSDSKLLYEKVNGLVKYNLADEKPQEIADI